MKKVLTIAGSDSGGGAGIQADLKTMTVHGVYAASVITSVTAQNTLGVQQVNNLAPEFVAAQIDSVLGDIKIDALKTGMLGTKEIVEITAEKIKEYGLKNLVVDPVMAATSGDLLLAENAVESYKEKLFPLAKIITPNLMEAKILAGKDPTEQASPKWLAEKLIEYGSEYVLIKGGHFNDHNPAQKISKNKSANNLAVDLLYDGSDFVEFEAKYIQNRHTHGSGCTLSASLASNLAKSLSIKESLSLTKAFITDAIKNSFKVGKGNNPVNHIFSLL
ncbi:MAG: bifunctional hydroxymethylpyrimidine kinase/phosphomethylpyrimidine kinase [Halanaerobium sp.]